MSDEYFYDWFEDAIGGLRLFSAAPYRSAYYKIEGVYWFECVEDTEEDNRKYLWYISDKKPTSWKDMPSQVGKEVGVSSYEQRPEAVRLWIQFGFPPMPHGWRLEDIADLRYCQHEDEEYSWWEYDKNGIELAKVCVKCQGAKMSQYNPEYIPDCDIEPEE